MAQELIQISETRYDEDGNPYQVIISQEYVDIPEPVSLEQKAQDLMAELQSVLNQIKSQNS